MPNFEAVIYCGDAILTNIQVTAENKEAAIVAAVKELKIIIKKAYNKNGHD